MIRTFSKRNKFNAERSRCLSGHFHRSKLEARVCNRLLAMVQNKEISSYQTEVKFCLLEKSETHGAINYYADFVLYDNEKNMVEVWEAKGKATQTWIIKEKLFRAKYPNIKLTVVKK